jgi:hypothetical protein
MGPANDIPQSERRQVSENDRVARRAATYHSLASADIDQERGGRFATMNKPAVTGTDPAVRVPQQPANSFWSRDLLPPEPPLGWSVEAQEPVGEVWEVEQSMETRTDGRASSPSARVDGGTPATSVSGDGSGAGVISKRRFRRRI